MSFKQKIKTEKKERFYKDWENLITHVKEKYQSIDPTSDEAIAIGQEIMDLVNNFYGPNYVHIRDAFWKKGHKKGLIPKNYGYLEAELVQWFDDAVSAYYKNRIMLIIEQITRNDNDSLIQQWRSLMEEMCGQDKAHMDEIKKVVLEKTGSHTVKEWFEKNFPS